MIIPVLILLLFVIAALLMFFRKLPALLALPLMAVGIGVIEVLSGRITLADCSLIVIADGAVRLYEPMIISMFGGILSVLLQKSGVAENIVRRGAELAGDNPWLVSILMTALIALLFTTIGGLGAVIMVGTIVLPILASIGIREVISGGILLFGISIGGLLNANNWALYKTVLRLPDAAVASYALMLFGVSMAGVVIFVTIELIRSGTVRIAVIRSSIGWMLGLVAGIVILGALIEQVEWTSLILVLRIATFAALAMGIALAIRDYWRGRSSERAPVVHSYAYLTTVVPLLLILVFGMPFITAFLCGIAYGWLTTLRRGSLNMLSRSILEGSASVMPAVVLMMGIGMLISAILGPTRNGPGASWYSVPAVSAPAAAAPGVTTQREWPVTGDMKPLIESIVPGSRLSYILIFALLGPLALYRGPLNVWGLGYGVGGVLLATGVPAGGVMGILMSLGMIQGVSDPTNTQNVWVANELRVGVNEILWRTLPYAWGVAILGLVVAGMYFY